MPRTRQFASDSRCVYVDRPGGLPTAIFVDDGPVAGPFCARCGHPFYMHRGKDNRCLKYANTIPGPTPEYIWGWLCEDCRLVFFTTEERKATDHCDKHKHSLARCSLARAKELKEERRHARAS